MTEESQKSPFKVLIVGGSVAGLTLANALSRAGVDFLILENRGNVDACIGGAITIISNGLTILDQMGMYEDILDLLEPAEELYTWLPDGRMLVKMDTARVLRARHNYPLAWLARQNLLRILLKHLPEKNKILHDKKVLTVDHSAAGVIAHCSDGTSYNGNIIAGADGIHSTVRSEMWRNMDICQAGDLLKKDKAAMTADYLCILGISSATEGLSLGEVHRTWCEGFSTFLNVGKDGQLFWFIFIKMDRRYHHTDIPKLTKEDLDRDVNAYLGVHIAPGVRFATVYRNAITSSYVPLEEVNYECWTWGRFACLGDAVHKTTPNIGQGASLAIEDAASLANHIVSILRATSGSPESAAISSYLEKWASRQKPRSKLICLAGVMFTRLEALATYVLKIVALYFIPYLGDLFADVASQCVTGGPYLDFVPLPKRCLNAAILPDGTSNIPGLRIPHYIQYFWGLCLRIVS